jgi:thioredoxin 1
MKTIKVVIMIITAGILLSCTGTGTGSGSGSGSGGTVYLSQEDFIKKVFNYKQNGEWRYLGDKPAVIDFYADWCKPCKMVSPIMEELAKQYEGKVIFYKMNVDKEKELAAAFQIQSIPTLLFIPAQGQPQASIGVQSKEDYIKIIESTLISSN